MRRRTCLLAMSTLGLAALCSTRGWAYVREVTSTGLPIAWSSACVSMHMRVDVPAPPVLPMVQILVATNQAMAAWSYPQVASTDVRLSLVTESGAALQAGYDKKNVIVFRQDSWCRVTEPGSDAGSPMEDCYPSSALAVTSIFKNTKTGDIVDTDIEFNAVDYTWGDLAGQPSLVTANTADYQNALTHELGHVLGLDHSCYSPNDGPTRLYDNSGSLTVDCYNNPDLPEPIASATMYPSVVLDDTARRSLSSDDELGVSEIYPHLHDKCPSSDGGCRMAVPAGPSRRGWPEMLAVLVLLLGAFTMRRGHRGTRKVFRQR